jgi:hypothetical protein
MSSNRRREQITIPVDPRVREAIEAAAEAEHRTIAGQIRHWIAAALAKGEAGAKRARAS